MATASMNRSLHSMRTVICLAAALVAWNHVYAQQVQPIPIWSLAQIKSTDSGTIRSVATIRSLSNGNVLVLDTASRRLLLIDSTLKAVKVVADVAGAAENRYGTGGAWLLPFLGDSTIFVDRASAALVVVDPHGKFGRVMAPLRVSDLYYMSGVGPGIAGFDAKGRLYTRGVVAPAPIRLTAEMVGQLHYFADSLPLIRTDFSARTYDTLAWLKTPRQRSKVVQLPGRLAMSPVLDPLPRTDEWAYFADGTVAIVRAADYHIEWILPDGTRRNSAKMPFDWRKVTASDADRLVDSLKALLGQAARQTPVDQGRSTQVVPAGVEVSPPNELPDYYPPLRVGVPIRVDPKENVWILPSTSVSAREGQLLDVVNRKGEIVERIQLPGGRTLIGFAAGDIIFMAVPAGAGSRLESARIMRK